MKTCAIVAALSFATLASAQTIYQPVRYQYGQYNEICYGGMNPVMTSNHYIYLPEQLRAAYQSRRENVTTFPYPQPYSLYGPGTVFVSPYFQSRDIDYPSNRRLVFSDTLPGEEVGQFGYTIDNARNEAYSNVPRIQVMSARPVAVPPPVAPVQAAPSAPVAVQSDPRAKAIPLINWARAEHSRNPALYQALIKESAKYDADATAKLEKEFQSPAP